MAFALRVMLYQATIIALAILLTLAPSQAGAQIIMTGGYNNGWERAVRWDLQANGFSGDYATPSQVSPSPDLPFQGVATGTVFTSWINNRGENASSGAFGRMTQSSTHTSSSIVTSSNGPASAQFSNTDGFSGGSAHAQGSSNGSVFFQLDEYCRFSIVGNVSGNAFAIAQPDFNTGGNAGGSASGTVSLANAISGVLYGVAQGTAVVGYDNPSNNFSAALSTSGFLPAATYVLGNSNGLQFGVGQFGSGSTQGTASTFVSLSVVPMGTRVAGFEVVQTIQDWNNSVALIAGKPTYVRAHVEPISAASVPIMNARLRGYVYGTSTELPGSPLSPLPNGASTAQPNAAAADRRADWQGSVNFRLPDTWTSSNIRLHMEMDGLRQSTASNETIVFFTASPQLDLRIVKVSVIDGTTVISSPPSTADIQMEVTRLAELYPITRESIRTTETSLVISGNAQLTAEEFLEKIKIKRLQEGRSAIYVAAASGTLSGDLAGISDGIPGNIVSARIDQPGTLAHEIGHALGEFHTVNQQIFDVVTPADPDPVFLPETIYSAGPLNCSGEILAAPRSRAVDFPFFDTSGLPRIGPMNLGTNYLVYGLEHAYQPELIRGISPYNSVDLMMGSDCNGTNWISTHTYGRLRDAMLSRTATASQLPPPGPPLPYVVVRGLVDFVGNTATILPVVPVSLSSPPAAPGGNTHSLNVYFRSGANTYLAYSIPFTPDTRKREGNSASPGKGFFSIAVAGTITDIARVEVLRNSSLQAVRIRTSSAPVIQLVSPNGGEILASSPLLASWNATDADGDVLTYQIQFSPDGGQNWQTLAVDWPTTSFSLSGDSLPAGTNAIFKVTASDGVNASSSQSAAPFTVLNHAPVIAVISPPAGTLFRGDVPIVLEALASDLEDGALPANSVTWTSSLDGLLGNGQRVEKNALLLSEGSHVITVSAVDAAGATSTATVPITVSRLFGVLSLTAQPANQTVTAGQYAIFTVAASGWPVPAFQWQVSTDNGANWSNLTNAGAYNGADAATLTVNTSTGLSGYQYRGVVNNSAGTLNSNAATLTVNAAPTAPGAPVIGIPIAGNLQAAIVFTAPASNGGSPITAYTATCVNGGNSIVVSRATSPISLAGLVNGTTYTCSVTATNAIGEGAPSATANVTPDAAATLTLVNVQSRKTHTGAGVFNLDIVPAPLPADPVTVEPRVIGSGHLIVFQFNNLVTVAGTVAVVDAVTLQPISGATSAASGNEVAVTLVAAADRQRVLITIDGMNGIVAPVSASLGFLVGDVTNSRNVNAGDISATKARIGQPVGSGNFRFDVNTNGSITLQDVAMVKSRAGWALP